MSAPRYTALVGSDGKHGVDGPCHGMGYHSGTLWPHLRLSTEADAVAAAKLCEEADRAGYARALREVRELLGITDGRPR